MSAQINIEELKKFTLEYISLLQKQKLKFKNSILMDKTRLRVKMFRSDDYQKIIQGEDFAKKMTELLLKHKLPTRLQDKPQDLLNILMRC